MTGTTVSVPLAGKEIWCDFGGCRFSQGFEPKPPSADLTVEEVWPSSWKANIDLSEASDDARKEMIIEGVKAPVQKRYQ